MHKDVRWSRRLGELAAVQTGPFGSQLHESDYVTIGTPIVTVEHLGERRLSYGKVPHVSRDDKERLFKYQLHAGDVVFSRVGSVDRCSLVSTRENGWLFSGRCLCVRPQQEIIDPDYLYYFFCQTRLKEHIRSIAVGATMPSINTAILSNVEVTFPELQRQSLIAATLSCLDDKIELNNRMNKTLEDMAQAIFKSWFVDFEPFKDGEFEDSELGPIPKGWRVGTLEDLGAIVGGSTPSKSVEHYYCDEGGVAWITPKDLAARAEKFVSRGAINITESGFQSSSVRILPPGSVLFSSRAPIGYIAVARNELTTNQGFKSVIPKKEIGVAFVYYTLINSLDIIDSRAVGSTFKEISGSAMKSVPSLLPDHSSLARFGSACEYLFHLQRNFEDQNRALASMRDTLLPKLMSGEIRVPEAERLLEEAL